MNLGKRDNLSNKEKAYLNILAEYRILTTKQLSYINDVGLRATQKSIKSLCEKGLIRQSYNNYSSVKGRPESFLSLNEKGISLIKSDPSFNIYVNSPRETDAEKLHIKHEILVNWFRIHQLNIDRRVADLKTEFLSTNTLFLPRRKNGAPLISDSTPIDNQKKWFVPDGVFVIKSKKKSKSLLFFVEVDMSTESLSSSKSNVTSIANKLKCYYSYYKNQGFKRYQKKWPGNFNGFRVLFLCNSLERKETISRYLINFDMFNFIWITDVDQMQLNGLAANIWTRGGNSIESLKSILGPSLTFKSPLKDL